MAGLKFKRANDPDTTDRYFSLLLIGPSGVGKTWMASTAGRRPLVLLTEDNGEQSVRHGNPAATYIVVHTMDEVREVLRMVKSGAFAAETGASEPFDVLVIDGLTEIQRLFKDEITENGANEMSIADWGELTDMMRLFVRTLTRGGFKLDIVCTAIAEESFEDIAGGKRQRCVIPSFQGQKFKDEVGQFFAAVGLVHREIGGTRRRARGQTEAADATAVRYTAQFDGPDGLRIKPCFPLSGTVEGPAWEWFDLLRNAGVKPPEAPEPSADKPADAKPAEPASRGRGRGRTAEGKAETAKPAAETAKPEDPKPAETEGGPGPAPETAAPPAAG